MGMTKFVLPVFMVMVMALSGCNTFKGMGKDIEGAGHGIQKASDKTREAITK
jgi:predicted small secreted protein